MMTVRWYLTNWVPVSGMTVLLGTMVMPMWDGRAEIFLCTFGVLSILAMFAESS